MVETTLELQTIARQEIEITQLKLALDKANLKVKLIETLVKNLATIEKTGKLPVQDVPW